jgi:tetratricopeptide (TPR) repeat protein
MTERAAKLRAFLTELRRRKVYRTGAAYAIGVFAVWQVIDIMAPALGWPESVLTFFVVASFALSPLVLALAWIYDVRREPDAKPVPEDTPATEGAAAPDPVPQAVAPPRRPALAVLAPAILMAAGITWVLWPRPSSGLGSFEEGDRTIIAECENTTGDANFDGLLNTALVATIRQSEYVSVLSHDRARSYATSFLNRTPPVSLGAATATEIGVRLGYKVVILCAIRRVGEGYVVEARIMEPRSQEDLRTRTERARDADGILRSIDRLAAAVRSDLGESLRAVRSAEPLANVTTSSLDALFSYTAGNLAWDRGDYAHASELYQEALQRDSLFGAAHAALGNYYYLTFDYPRGSAEYRKALSRPDRIGERDRMWIEALFAANRDERERAIALYDTYLERWPGDARMWYNLGSQYFRARDCDAAGRAFARALAIDPSDAASHINLASCLTAVGQIDSSLVHYEEAFRIQPRDRQDPGLNHEYGQALVEAGRIEDAERLFTSQFELSADQQAAARRSLAMLRVRQGRYGEARTLLSDAARQRRALEQGLSEYRDRLYLAGVLDALGDRAGKASQVAAVEAIAGRIYLSPGWLLRSFNRYIADGQTARARSVLERAAADTVATSTFDRAAVHAMRALLEAMGGRARAGLEEARLATEIDNELIYVEPLCRTALMADDTTEAIDACRRLAQPVAGFGLWEATEPGILANYWLGKLHERIGEPDEARQWYTRFLGFWNGADAGLTHRDWAYRSEHAIADARERLSVLTER